MKDLDWDIPDSVFNVATIATLERFDKAGKSLGCAHSGAAVRIVEFIDLDRAKIEFKCGGFCWTYLSKLINVSSLPLAAAKLN